MKAIPNVPCFPLTNLLRSSLVAAMKFAAKILFATIVLVANHPAFAVRRQKRLGEEQVAQHRRTRYYTNEDGVVTAAGGGKSGKGKSNDSDGKSGKGKSNSDGKSGKGKGRFGGGKSGKNGKSGKSSASDQVRMKMAPFSCLFLKEIYLVCLIFPTLISYKRCSLLLPFSAYAMA